MRKLLSEERETIVTRNRSDDFVSITTTDSADIRLMEKLGIEPYMSQGYYHQYRVPKSWYRRTSKGWAVSRPRACSQKQRENASRLGKIYGSQKIQLMA